MFEIAHPTMIRRWFLLPVTLLLSACCALPAQDTWTGVDRVVAIGDVHGDFERLTTVLRSVSTH